MAETKPVLTREDVRKVALLARLAVTPEEEERYARQLGEILGAVERLQQLDVTGIEPTAHAVLQPLGTRADVVKPSLSHDDAMRNAPVKVDGNVAVPKIIE